MIREKIEALLSVMEMGAYEREESIGLALLSAIAGESIFLLGLPGVGKSMIARRLKLAFKDSTSFEYLMSRFSTPDEIFGPVSISQLKENDNYERVIDGYLPTADVVFLDEIWKAGPSIQNSLLTVLNEKIFRNGKQELQLPLKAVISASNELPAEGEGLEALWDRFLIRYVVEPIRNKKMFLTLLCGKSEECCIPEELKLTSEELESFRQEIPKVILPNEIMELIFSIRKTLDEQKNDGLINVDVTKTDWVEPPYVSDRRWKKIVGILKTSAYLNGRQEVDYSDCLLLNHMLWDKDEQILAVRKFVEEAVVTSICQCQMPMGISFIKDKRYSRPVGDFISLDGAHYLFDVGDEEMRIAISDYDHLPPNTIKYGRITNDNRLVFSDSHSTLAVLKTDIGLSINSFDYPLKRNSSLRSASIKSVIDDIEGAIDMQEKLITYQLMNNLFVPSNPFTLEKVFANLKSKIIMQGH